MLTRTIANQWAEYGIYVNAVDTGWVTDEAPARVVKFRGTSWEPPLDSVDGAARVLDPVRVGRCAWVCWGALLVA